MDWLDIRWYTFRPPDKRRPVLVLTRPDVLARMEKVVVVGIRSTERHVSSEVSLDESDGMPTHCVINFDNLFTVSRQAIERDDALITTLKGDIVPELRSALLMACGFAEIP